MSTMPRPAQELAENQWVETPFIGEGEAALRPLEAQDQDRQGRAVQEGDEEREERRQT